MRYSLAAAIISTSTAIGRSSDSASVAGEGTHIISDAWTKQRAAKKARVVNGTNVAQAAIYPFLGFVHQYDPTTFKSQLCAGSLVAERFVLTAATCYPSSPSAVVSVGFGATVNPLVSFATKWFTPIEFHVAPGYNNVTLFNNIMLWEFDEDITESGFTPILLNYIDEGLDIDSTIDIDLGVTNVTVAGWGATVEGGGYTNRLMETLVDVLPQEDCMNYLMSRGDNETDGKMCAYRESTDACDGDEGAPLFIYDETVENFVQLGTASYGEGCALKDHPRIYTNMLDYSSLIYEYIGNLTDGSDDDGGGGGYTNGTSCVDDPVNWVVDIFGSTCQWYFQNEEPGCPNYGEDTGTNGLPANEACCYCGGGACVDAADWIDNFGTGCQWYVDNDLPGCPSYGGDTGTNGLTANEACCYCAIEPGSGFPDTPMPSASPSASPSAGPNPMPSTSPSASPSAGPNPIPSSSPSASPSAGPNPMPIVFSDGDTPAPVTSAPIVAPTATGVETSAPVTSSAIITTSSVVNICLVSGITSLSSLIVVFSS